MTTKKSELDDLLKLLRNTRIFESDTNFAFEDQSDANRQTIESFLESLSALQNTKYLDSLRTALQQLLVIIPKLDGDTLLSYDLGNRYSESMQAYANDALTHITKWLSDLADHAKEQHSDIAYQQLIYGNTVELSQSLKDTTSRHVINFDNRVDRFILARLFEKVRTISDTIAHLFGSSSTLKNERLRLTKPSREFNQFSKKLKNAFSEQQASRYAFFSKAEHKSARAESNPENRNRTSSVVVKFESLDAFSFEDEHDGRGPNAVVTSRA